MLFIKMQVFTELKNTDVGSTQTMSLLWHWDLIQNLNCSFLVCEKVMSNMLQQLSDF